MTTKTTERDLVEEVEELLAKATPGPWAVWDSCSWRRIGTRQPYQDGNVICPITQSDGHPDLLAKREDLELAAAAPELLRRLVEEVKTRDELIVHMHVHSGYPNNGYMQMTTPQKELYDTIWNRSVKELDDEEQNHA